MGIAQATPSGPVTIGAQGRSPGRPWEACRGRVPRLFTLKVLPKGHECMNAARGRAGAVDPKTQDVSGGGCASGTGAAKGVPVQICCSRCPDHWGDNAQRDHDADQRWPTAAIQEGNGACHPQRVAQKSPTGMPSTWLAANEGLHESHHPPAGGEREEVGHDGERDGSDHPSGRAPSRRGPQGEGGSPEQDRTGTCPARTPSRRTGEDAFCQICPQSPRSTIQKSPH